MTYVKLTGMTIVYNDKCPFSQTVIILLCITHYFLSMWLILTYKPFQAGCYSM